MHLAQVVGGTAYIDDQKGGLYALNGENGRLRWKYAHSLGDVPTGPLFLGATDSAVYYGAGEYTYARDAGSGEELWKWKDHGIHPSIEVVGEKLYASDVRLIARDARTGREMWTNTYKGFSKQGPVVSGGVVFAVISDGTLRAVDAETGADLWRIEAGDQLASSPVAANGTVYFGVRDGSLHAVNAATGRYAWKQGFEGAFWDPAIAGRSRRPDHRGRRRLLRERRLRVRLRRRHRQAAVAAQAGSGRGPSAVGRERDGALRRRRRRGRREPLRPGRTQRHPPVEGARGRESGRHRRPTLCRGRRRPARALGRPLMGRGEVYAPLEAGDPEQLGPYRLVGRLGGGGMGQVFLASSPGGRAVAVKAVRAELAEDPGFRRRFVREVEAARRVSGPFTAAVVDADPGGAPPWLATEYVPGLSLKAAIDAHGALPDGTVRALGAALAEALEGVHAAGVVHRDLKPSNVLLAPDGPRLIDFGIALASEGTRLTVTGAMVGTPGFMSPEQLRGGAVGPASDVFSLGAVLAYAATGTGPFRGGSVHALNYRIVHGDPDLTGVPSGLADVVARCLDKDPRRRPTVPDLVAELGRASRAWPAGWLPEPLAAEITRTVVAPPPTPTAVVTAPYQGPPHQAPAPRRLLTRGRALTGLAAVTVLVIIATTLLLTGGEPDADRAGRTDRAAEPSPPVLKQLWSYGGDTAWPPQVKDGTVYFGDGDGVIHAVDARTGEARWKRDREWGGGNSLIIAGNRIYVSAYTDSSRDSDSGRVFALDAGSGRRLWESHGGTLLLGEAVSGRHMYLFHRTSDEEKTSVYALGTGTGKKAWSHEAGIVWEMTAHGNVVYYVASTYDEPGPQLHALNADTGERLWKAPFSGDIRSRPESLTVTGGVIYAIGEDGTVSARDPGNGALLWNTPTGLRDFSDSWLPVLSDGVLYVSGNADSQGDAGQAVAFNAKTGAMMWRRDLPQVSSSPTVSSGTAYVSTKTGELHLLNAGDGASLGKVRLADGRDPNAVVSGGVVYFGAGDGHLRAAAITR
ncbi:PQQ-binding-like beta-propeller repeat protein [Actinomadura madurae]|nr:PQQ-binding-like beta-propeller repeat protein [Actinomadura madurae]MCP9984443.1 PQQ-binding-like beta-propeller repeat protein [Actinomadura madurae]